MTSADSQTTLIGGTGAAGAGLPAPGEEIVARAGRYYRNTRYILTAALFGMAAWFAYDGWVAWPRDNEIHRLHEKDPIKYPENRQPHSDTDIWFQKVLATTLPLLGLALLSRTLYNSRGAYRLKDDVLSVPGHPDVPLEAITKIDKSKWDRKGIAYLDYDVSGRTGTLRLDDFVYDRPPTDRILETIEAKLLPEPPPRGFEVVEGAGADGPATLGVGGFEPHPSDDPNRPADGRGPE